MREEEKRELTPSLAEKRMLRVKKVVPRDEGRKMRDERIRLSERSERPSIAHYPSECGALNDCPSEQGYRQQPDAGRI